MINFFDSLNEALHTSYLDREHTSNESMRARLVYNDVKKGNTVLSKLQKELISCDSFWMSVAFVTDSGLITLKNQLKELEEKGIRGKILTTNYLNFSTPKAFKQLMDYENLDIRVSEENFHTKGYMFCKGTKRTFMIGSSNMTQNAYKKNKEWNLLVTSMDKGEVISQLEGEFHSMWEASAPLTENWLKEYEKTYNEEKQRRRAHKVERIKTYSLEPNKMQTDALEALRKLRTEGKDKALLISATGTGKTYLSAFDIRNAGAKKVLFLAHREKLLTQAEESLKDVIGDYIDSGIVSGQHKSFKADYIFSTVNMMSKEDVLNKFSKTHFDYIVIDETHRAVAKSYKKIMDYFKPKFILGMTATPERLDGESVFELYDYNIAYEIRLQQALGEDILCPFHYFGISELLVDDKLIEDNSEFKYLVSDDRVNHIIEKIKYYGYSGDRARGLIFCSNIKEAEFLSKSFNSRGYRTIFLSGKNSQEERDCAIERLEMDECKEALDYIFSVDIMNEGVDIPSLNQVIMLRPTQSAIVFVQQLGRGLRKYKDKEYVVVLDFIGNYQNNYMIPIALSGNRSYAKDDIRRYVAEGSRVIPGVSTISFDEVSRAKIYDSLDKARFSDVKFLRKEYNQLRDLLGRIPTIEEFGKFGSIDIIRYLERFGSYHQFLIKYEKDYSIEFSKEEENYITYFSKKLANGKRIHEILLIDIVLEQFKDMKSDSNENIRDILEEKLNTDYNIELTISDENSMVSVLQNEFLDANQKKGYGEIKFIERVGSIYRPGERFVSLLKNEDFFRSIKELTNYAIARYEEMYSERYKGYNLQLYRNYSYEDVCRLLNWEKNMNGGVIGGYIYHEESNTFPIFINYHKCEDSIAYEDRFTGRDSIIALSKNNRGLNSSDAKIIYGKNNNGKRPEMLLFVRKNKVDKNDSKEFYFLGNVDAEGSPRETVLKGSKLFEINYKLETAVREDIYDYITEVSLDA